MEEPKIVVYTAIVNNYDALRNPEFVDDDITYVCFTDEPIWMSMANDTIWQIRRIPRSDLDDTRKARQVKILFHRFLEEFDCDVSVWIDGNVTVIGDVRQLVREHRQHKLIGFKHPMRNCIYEEAETCIEQMKDSAEVIRGQMGRYEREGYPRNHGLTESNVLIRDQRDGDVRNLMDLWWSEVRDYSKRDQLSFCYCAWRNGFEYKTLGDENARGTSRYFRVGNKWRTASGKSRLRILVDRLLG